MRSDIDRVRAFNRGWTEVLTLLDRGLLGTEYSLAEARVLFELAQRGRWERQALKERLGMDASFLTRVLRRLESRQLVTTSPSPDDGRAVALDLTDDGAAAAELLDERAGKQIADLLDPLTADERVTVVEAMTTLSHLFRLDRPDEPFGVRGPDAGDLGWIVARHGTLYRDEYGWNQDFEALVARIVADYHQGKDRERENAWIAQVGGARAGCVLCCRADEQTAQLRLLLVEPWARGLGLGTHLVEECIAFARAAGYHRLKLWTNHVLSSARRIYEAAGFTLVEQEPHHSFGRDLVGQVWELPLHGAPGSS